GDLDDVVRPHLREEGRAVRDPHAPDLLVHERARDEEVDREQREHEEEQAPAGPREPRRRILAVAAAAARRAWTRCWCRRHSAEHSRERTPKRHRRVTERTPAEGGRPWLLQPSARGGRFPWGRRRWPC